MLKYTFWSILFVIVAKSSFGQTLTVTDSSSHPIANVVVKDSARTFGTTNDQGQLNLSESSDFNYLIFSHISYSTITLSKESLENQNYKVEMNQSTLTMNPIWLEVPFERHRHDMGNSIRTIDQIDIANNLPQTSADLLGLSGQVYIQKSQMGGGSPMIRGFATNRVLIVVDGVRMNTAIFRTGNVQNVLAIDPYTVDKAEIVFGPLSQFYGSDAIGGVLNFQTKYLSVSDSTSHHGSAQLKFSSANRESTLHADFSASGKKFASYSSFTMAQFSDLRMGSNGLDLYLRPDYVVDTELKDTVIVNDDPLVQYGSGYSQLNIAQKFIYQPSSKIRFGYSLFHSNNPETPRYDRLIQRNGDGNLRFSRWSYGPQNWTMNQINADIKGSGKLFNRANFIVAQQRFTESRIDRRWGSSTQRSRYETVDAISVNMDFELLPDSGKRWELKYGGEWVKNFIGSEAKTVNIYTGAIGPLSTRYPDGSEWSSAGLYLHAMYHISKYYQLEGGIRGNTYKVTGELDTTFYPFPSPAFSNQNGAITYSLEHLFTLKKLNIGVISSSAYRAPNIDDISKVFDSNPGNVIIPNPELQPEVSYTFELNFSTKFKRINLLGNGYYTYLKNAINKTNSTFNGNDSIWYDGVFSNVQILSNSEMASIYGYQLVAQYSITRQLELTSSYSWFTGSDKEGQPIRHSTPAFGATHVTYKHKRMYVDLNAVYNAKFTAEQFPLAELDDRFLYPTDANGDPYAPSWYTLNLRVSYRINDHFIVNGGMDNILDKRYRPYGSGITAPGRDFVLSIRSQF